MAKYLAAAAFLRRRERRRRRGGERPVVKYHAGIGVPGPLSVAYLWRR